MTEEQNSISQTSKESSGMKILDSSVIVLGCCFGFLLGYLAIGLALALLSGEWGLIFEKIL